MAVAFLQEFAPTGDTSTTNYDSINERIGSEAMPAGLIVHSAGFGEDGTFRIYDVWESMEDLERFKNERLMPLVTELMAAGDAAAPTRQVEYELHNVISPVRAGVS